MSKVTKLKPFDKMKYHPLTDELVKTLSLTTQSNNHHMFHVMITYYWGVIATHMRANIVGWFNSRLPLNIYSICLAESGTGKGYTVNTMEEQIINRFRSLFVEETFPVAAEEAIEEIANFRATKRGTNPERERERVQKEFDDAGNFLFVFSEGSTAAALKQYRHKLVIANAGSLSFQVDEIGNNLLKSDDLLPACLELYDKGSIKDKLIKNTSENKRVEHLEGFTPMNMLLFGTSSSLLNGGETEAKFMSMLESGYARRSFFSFSQEADKHTDLTADQIVERMFNQHHDELYEETAAHLETLADVVNLDRELVIKRESVHYLVQYKMNCENRSRKLKSHQRILKAELQHRYFKALKAAASYAFIDCKSEVDIEYLEYGIKLAEESGNHLEKLLNPDKDFMRLARFLCEQEGEVTLPDIELGLPCFTGSASRKQEMITSATAWGYRNNILITKRYVDQILFLTGKALEETDLDQLIVSLSDDPARNYQNDIVPFESLAEFGEIKNMNWINHHVEDERRARENIIPGFNVIVLDVDDGTPIETAMELLSGYYAIYYDTKSSTPSHNRFRVILPINYVLELEHEDYYEFMTNIINTLPFDIDSAVCDREHKWLTHDAGADVIDYYTENGIDKDCKIFDVLEYIPRTTKNEERIKRVKEYENLDGLQYWIMSTTGEGNRNKQLYRYAMVLVDKGYDYQTINEKVIEMNKGLKDGISDKEIANTIMSSVARKIK